MFDKKRYITVGIYRNIPPPIQEFLWELIDRMTVDKDYLQVFELYEKDGQQELEHRQEQPKYKKVYVLQNFAPLPIDIKIFVLVGKEYSTMLLASEY